MIDGERDALGPVAASSVSKAGETQHVPGEPQVLLVVVDDEDEVAVTRSYPVGSRGSVKRKVLPSPGTLSTQSRPPCSSTNFRESGSPRPVPSCRPR